MKNIILYNEITKFSKKYGYHKFNDEKNHAEYMKLVDMCITLGIIHPANREEFSTHSCLDSAIIYVDNRYKFCS